MPLPEGEARPGTWDAAPAAARLQARLGGAAALAVILGSGLSAVADHLGLQELASHAEVGLPQPSVAGHRGRVSGGEVEGLRVLAFQGRGHLYEGHTLESVTRGARLALAAGAHTLLLTCAAGGLSPDLRERDLVVWRDHISLPGLCGYAMDREARAGHYPWPRFLSLDGAHDPWLRRLVLAAADSAGARARDGVYAMVWGPLYETPAERALLNHLGADAVGMSTVPEVIAAHAGGARVVAVAVITNVAQPARPPTHEEVARVSEQAASELAAIVRHVASGLD